MCVAYDNHFQFIHMKKIASLSLFLCLIMACIKEGPVGPKGPDGPPYAWPPGNITGYIELHDQFGDLIGRGDSVLLHTYNADSIFRAYTDSNGHFNLRGLPPGNYDISISKPGFDSLHMYVQHAGGMLDKFTGFTTMSKPVTTKLLSITLDTLRSYIFPHIDVKAIFEWPQPFIAGKVAITAFLDTSSVPGSGRSLSTFYGFADNMMNIDNTKGSLHGYFRTEDSLLKTVTRVYVTVVVIPPYFARSSWFNYATLTEVPYPYPGDSIKASIILPK